MTANHRRYQHPVDKASVSSVCQSAITLFFPVVLARYIN